MAFLLFPFFLFSLFALYSFTIKPHSAVFFILLSTLIDTWLVVPVSINAGLNIFLNDPLFILIFVSGLYRVFLMGQFKYISPLWVIYGFLLFISAFIGLQSFGTASGVDFRYLFYYWSGGMYFMSFSYTKEMLDKIIKYWLIMCSFLLLIVYFRFVAELLHLPISATWISADSGDIRFRVINSGQAYLLCISIIMLFSRYLITNQIKPSKIMVTLFIIAVIGVQHRSVWAATLFALVSATLLPGIKSTKLLGNLFTIGLLGLILLIPLIYLGYADNLIAMVSKSANRAQDLSSGTFGARVKGWQYMLKYWLDNSFINQLFGDPFGGGYAKMRSFPHNFTIQNLLRVGIVGTIIFYCFYLQLLAKLYLIMRNSKEEKLYLVLFFMLIITQITYYIPYGTGPEHGIILGIAASLVRRRNNYITTKNTDNTRHDQYFLKPLPETMSPKLS